MVLGFYVVCFGHLDKISVEPEKREKYLYQSKSSEILGTSSELGKTFETLCIPLENPVKPNNKELMRNRTIDVEHLCKQFQLESRRLKKALTSGQIQHISHPTFSMYFHQISGFLESDFADY